MNNILEQLEFYYDHNIISFDNEQWIIVFQFKSMPEYKIYINLLTDEYAFHTFIDDYTDFPNFGKYESFDLLLDGIINKYIKKLKK